MYRGVVGEWKPRRVGGITFKSEYKIIIKNLQDYAYIVNSTGKPVGYRV